VTPWRKSLLRTVSGGIADAGLASLATFVVGFAATRVLGPADLGVYAIFFTAFLTATVVPAQLVFTPAEVECVAYPTGQRTRVLRQSLRAGNLISVGAALTMLLATAAAWRITTPDTLVALTATSIFCAYLSPMQDHVRRVQIQDGAAWLAAIVSTTQLVAVIIALALLSLTTLAPAWLPFGALALANATSLATGLAVSRYLHLRPLPDPMSLRTLFSAGRWLALGQLLPTGAAFLAATIISALAGAEELGYAEAARIAAQPLLVIGMGLATVFQPRFMVAAGRRDLHAARRVRLLFYGSMALSGAGYLLIGGWSWPLNPMAYVMPDAYVIPGMVALYVVANWANGASYAGWSELVGGGHEQPLARVNTLTSAGMLVAAVTAGVTGAYSRPLGMILQSLARLLMYRPTVRRMYRTSPTMADHGGATSDLADVHRSA
jgi:O-antigen/teichoic acid export membrane protein